MNVLKLAAFSHNGKSRNLVGMAFCDTMPSDEEMLKIAKKVGYSETAFGSSKHMAGVSFA